MSGRRQARRFESSAGIVRFLALSCALVLAGCHFTTFEDPNDPNNAGLQQPEVLRRQLKGASDALLARRDGGEISDAKYRDLLAGYAQELLKDTTIEQIPVDKAWEYAEVFRTARMWRQAEALYRAALKNDRDESRLVNDRLRLAESLAYLGKVAEAITTARETYAAPPKAKVPILYGVLLEIVPAARGKGNDAALARLLEDAIQQAEIASVDPSTPSGRAFLEARPFHQHNARELAARLYLSGGDSASAERVLGGKLSTLRV